MAARTGLVSSLLPFAVCRLAPGETRGSTTHLWRSVTKARDFHPVFNYLRLGSIRVSGPMSASQGLLLSTYTTLSRTTSRQRTEKWTTFCMPTGNLPHSHLIYLEFHPFPTLVYHHIYHHRNLTHSLSLSLSLSLSVLQGNPKHLTLRYLSPFPISSPPSSFLGPLRTARAQLAPM